jgi:hypothetical protein
MVSVMQLTPDFFALAQRFDALDISAIALVGSYARGEAVRHSDIDLVRFTTRTDVTFDPPNGSYLIDGRLVVVKAATPDEVESWFGQPELAVAVIPGLHTAIPLIDRNGTFAALQKRAAGFTWDAEMRRRADLWASHEMVGWTEEVHKGLDGLRDGNVGRLLNARFGLSWGLQRVIQVQRGIMLAGDNAFFDAIADNLGPSSRWAQLRTAAFGIESGTGKPVASLRDQVIAGLHLFVETAALIHSTITDEDRPLVEDTVRRINEELSAPKDES